jgi:hypothetical protein
MSPWRKTLFAFMSRNAANPAGYFGIPPNQVVELGAQIRLLLHRRARDSSKRLRARIESAIGFH